MTRSKNSLINTFRKYTFQNYATVKLLKFQKLEKIAVITLKYEQSGSTVE